MYTAQPAPPNQPNTACSSGSGIISALDMLNNPIQLGENSHPEHGWSYNLRERIAQFNFQLVRTDKNKMYEKEIILNKMLEEISMSNFEGKNEYLKIIYKMIGQTRDIIAGKGEYELSYMMVYILNKYYPKLAQEVFKNFVIYEGGEGGEDSSHPYGSWKDIKYMCNYFRNRNEEHNTFVNFAIELICKQLRMDEIHMNDITDNALTSVNNMIKSKISLCCRWLPREKSKKFGWLFEKIAINYYSHFIKSSMKSKKAGAYFKAVTKAKACLRKLVSKINKIIDTTQIKQCNKTWHTIDFKQSVTSITLNRQKKAFLNLDKRNNRRCYDEDRDQCALNFKNYIEMSVKNNTHVKGKRVGLNDFAKEAIEHVRSYASKLSDTEVKALNSQWKNNAAQTNALTKFIAVVDTSGSMESDYGNPIAAAVALGCRVAEKSALGKRVLTFSSTPTWCNLEDCNNFTSMVDKIVRFGSWGMNTNFTATLELILDAIEKNKLSFEEVEDMVLVIFSDMQIDAYGNEPINETMYKRIERMYAECGLRTCGKPYKPPHLLFWNLRSTDGFPNISSQANTSMMSGFSPNLLNLFCEKGLDALKNLTPWAMLVESLSHHRYQVLEDTFIEAGPSDF